MFQQVIVTNPNLKPVNIKSFIDDTSAESEVMPLEFFDTYELELQETIQELNSELERSYSSDEDNNSSLEDDFEGQSSAINGALSVTLSQSDSEESFSDDEFSRSPGSKCEILGAVLQCKERTSIDSPIIEYELRLQEAVHELTNLSDTLVGSKDF